jgi:hypothetical protein
MSKCLDRLQDMEAAVEKTEQEAEAEAARYQPLSEAFRAVREATPEELGAKGLAFYDSWAERFCQAGTELVNAGLSDWLAGRAATTDPAEGLAVEIYQLGAEGKKEAIAGLLTKVFNLGEADAENQTKISSRGAVNAWLRRRLAEKLWDGLSHEPETGTVPGPQTGLGEGGEPMSASEGVSLVAGPPAVNTLAVSDTDLAIAIRSPHPEQSGTEVAGQSARDHCPPVRTRFENWALAIEHDKAWHVFKKSRGGWRHQGKAKGISKGRQEDLLKRFAAGGGFLSDQEAVKSVLETPSRYDQTKIMQIIKPEISRLRKVIRRNLQVTNDGVDPLPRDKNARGWQARIQIGYAVKSDADRLEFKVYEELSNDEKLDV